MQDRRSLSEETRTARPVPTVVSIQYLRAIAASLIVVHHAMGVPELAASYPRAFGQFGVDLFFVISGYIIWATTADGRRGPLAFWWARIVRVVPLYWVVTTLYIAAAVLLPAAVFEAGLDPVLIVKSYLFIPAENPATGDIQPVYSLGWTLNYEMFFYFIFGCCLFIRQRALRAALVVGALLLLVAAGCLIPPRGAVADVYTNALLLEFAAGVALALIAARLQGGAAFGWAVMGAAVVWLVVVYASGLVLHRLVAHGIPAVAMVAGGLILEPMARARPSRLGLMLGDASYSIYLAHPFAMRLWYLAFNATVGVASLANGIAFVATAVVVGVAGGVLSYLLLERPMLTAARRLVRRR